MSPVSTNVVALHRLGESLDPRDLGPEFDRARMQERYRIYAIWPDGEAKSWPQETPEQVGAALCTLAEEGEFEGDAAIGVLDTKGLPRGSGVWIVNPFTSARSRAGREEA
jgi:hypothetical protein